MLPRRKRCFGGKDPFIIVVSLRLTKNPGLALELNGPASLASAGGDQSAPFVNGGDIKAWSQEVCLRWLFFLADRRSLRRRPESSRYILVQVDRWHPKIDEAQSANQGQREHSKEKGSSPLCQADVFCACHGAPRTH